MAKHRPHALIDGYNLIKCVPLYSESLRQSLAAARTHIEAALESYAHRTGTEVTIFYDGDTDVAHPDYQQLCIDVGVLIDQAVYSRLGAGYHQTGRWISLVRHFETATALERDFWDMGLRG